MSDQVETPKTKVNKSETSADKTAETLQRAGMFKRLAAMVYDWLAVIALTMLLTIINLIMVSFGADYGIFDLTGHPDPSSYLNQQWWFSLEIIVFVWLFYAWFWYDGGQTIGMRAWRLRVQTQQGRPVDFKTAAMRAILALGGLGNLLIWIMPKQRLALQDRLTKTEMVILTKEQNKRIYLRGVEAPHSND